MARGRGFHLASVRCATRTRVRSRRACRGDGLRLLKSSNRLCGAIRLLAISSLLLGGCGNEGATPAGPSASSVVSIRISPATSLVGINGVASFSAVGLDAGGRQVLVPDVQWSALDPSVVAIDAARIATGLGPGTARIVAYLGALADTAVVTVAPIVDLTGRLALQNTVLEPSGLNQAGVIVGRMGPPTGPGAVPFAMGPDRQAIPLPLPVGQGAGTASGISDAGVIVGTSGTDFVSGRAVVWTTPAGASRAVTELPRMGTAASFGRAISPNGDYVAGSVFLELSPNNYGGYPARWARSGDGSWTFERISVSEGSFGEAFDVNDAGDLVGVIFSSAINFQAVLWRKQAGAWTTEKLGEPAGDGTSAVGINSAGIVVGRFNSSPVIWTPNGAAWAQQPLFSPQDGVESAFISGINDAGEIAGAFVRAGSQQAFRWKESTGVQQLGTLATRSAALAINAEGHVVGVSYDPVNALKRLGTLWPAK